MSPHWIKVFLLRSRHAPLTVAINCALELKHPVKTLSKIMQAKGRIVELYCSGRRAPNHKVWVDKLDLSASPLKSLTISGCTLIYKGWKPTFNLQHLELKDNNFTASFISQSLTTLKLRRMNKTNLPSMSSFYKMLSSLHNLRYLTLQGLLTQIASQTRPQQFSLVPGISLPSLLSLKLYRESEEECTRFLSRATFPQLTRLHTPFKKMESTLTSLSLPYKELYNIWSSTQLLTICPTDKSHLQLNLTSDGSLNHFEFFSDNQSNQTTRIVWIRWNSNLQLFCDLLTTLPPDKVYSVRVCWRSPSEHGLLTLASSLSTFPFLRDLRVMLVGDHKVYVDFLTDFLTSGIPSCGCVQPSGSSVEACNSCQASSASFFPDLRSLYFDMEGREQAEMVREMVRSTYRQFRNHRIACGRPITTTFGYYSTPLTK
ncbi:hypothetical protein AX16_004765 [Volvariella volvacea WC 439]|nr:hypothetical protein AX16_004765 [Volvariella volvacea WC 439]